MKKTLFLFAICIGCPLLAVADNLPAFPGAEGHGRYTTGGRGGTVYYVTSLDDDTENPKAGTFRYAVNQSGARTIIFAVSGTIYLKGGLNISNGNLTIAGQTAPGDGICLAGYPVNVAANNVIMRFLRIRMGDLDKSNSDGADALGGRGIKNVIIDHCSCSWSTDECVSFYGDENFTLQWCVISESLRMSNHSKGAHGYGGIWGGCNASFHHNLLIHHSSRTPRLGSEATTVGREKVDLRNNVMYNHGGNSCYGAEGMSANIVNCYYKPGPATPTGAKRGRIIAVGANETDEKRPRYGQYYLDGNVVSSNIPGKGDVNEVNATRDNWTYGFYNQLASSATAAEKAAMKLTDPLNAGLVTTHSAAVAFEKVVATAGCSMVRDEIDLRLAKEALNGTATFKGSVTQTGGIIDSQNDLKPSGAGDDWSPWPTLQSAETPLDTDKDGMPDAWEEANGLNPRYPLDRKTVAANGYTNLENYLNSLVEPIVAKELSDYLYVNGASYNDMDTRMLSALSENVEIRLDQEAQVVTVSASSPIFQLQLFDVAGNRLTAVTSKNASVVTFDVSVLSRGIYLLQVFSENAMPFVRKIKL